MATSKVPKLIKKYGKMFRKLSRKLNPVGTQYVLLKNNGRLNDFKVLLVLTDTWHEYSNYHKKVKFKTGRNDEEFVNALRNCTDVGRGTGKLEVYSIEQRDKVEPDGNQPFWLYMGTKTGETFTPPVI